MYIVYSDRHRAHATAGVSVEGQPLSTSEVPARAELILEAVGDAHLGSLIGPTDYGLGPILAVHDADYVAFLRSVYAENAAHFGQAGPVFTWTFSNRHAARKPRSFLGLKGYYAFGWATPILEGTWEAAYWSAQCAVTAAHLVGNGEHVAYALCRPPGHHAAADLFGGYCYLNNAAIAARYLQAGLSAGWQSMPGEPVVEGLWDGPRIAILDIDYHHGNGTQILFYSDPSVLFCSLHAHPDEDYPYYWGGADERGEGPATGTNCNWPLSRGTADAAYLAALDDALASIRRFEARYLVVSAGFDTVSGDPEGGFDLTITGLREMGARIAFLDLPTVVVQEGGYRLDRLGEDVVAFLQAFQCRA